MRKEPALILGLIQTVLALVVAFGFDLSGEKVGALMAVSAAVLAVVVRQNVYAPASVEILGPPEV